MVFKTAGITLALCLVSTVCQALIIIEPGTYTTQAIIYHDDKNWIAVFNKNTMSELRLSLTGDCLDKLSEHQIDIKEITLRIDHRIDSGASGTASVLEIKRIENIQDFPVRVGNNFEPVPGDFVLDFFPFEGQGQY